MRTFYRIKPKERGCVVIGKDNNGNHIEVSKGPIYHKEKVLIFYSPEAAQKYIDAHLDSTYMVEWVIYNSDYLCPECGDALEVRCVIGADETESGYTEKLCSCRNIECNTDWNVIINEKDDTILSIERYYFG